MSASSKFDHLSSSSPDRPLYGIGKRGSSSSAAASLERSGSFRENVENQILSSLPSMSRVTSTATQGDVTNFLQCLKFDPKVVAAEHKFNRQGDFKRLVSIAFGVLPDESPSGSSKAKSPSPSTEELKRLKGCLRESTIKARDRVKIFSEGLSVINKFFPSVPSRKRSRSDALSGDRSNTLLANDRSILGAGLAKGAPQNHAIGSNFELEQQKSEERTSKISFPNKRTRTSMVDPRSDIRGNTASRPSGNMDRDNKEMVRVSNSGAIQGEDRALQIGSDGWEKAKMKKKRSVIKADIGVQTKPIDSFRETKHGLQSRLHSADARQRLNDPTYGFRSGGSNGVGKSDGSSPQSSMGMRSSIPRGDLESNTSPILHDKKDRTTNSDKERVNLRAVNRTNVREEFNSASPTSSTKLNGTARAPRSVSSRVVPKLPSPVVQKEDWEISHCTTSKNTASVVPTNRNKRTTTPLNRSSSPPVANWSSISRTARRTNFVPVISNNDETAPALDTVSQSDINNDSGSGFPRRLHANSPQQQVKLKADHFSFSESEESGPTGEIKSNNNKLKKGDDVAEKVSTINLPPRKNKIVSGEENGDGIRRQGRTGRGFASGRGPTQGNLEKVRSMGTAKQLRTTKLGFEKNESKAGRPPTRKLSDRRAYTRQKHTTINASADFLDDGHEELLAAANAVINPSLPLSSPFWKQLEPLFGFISDLDIAYLNQQENSGSADSLCILSVDNPSTNPKSFGLTELGKGNPNEISLCQRLLAALITEEANEESQGMGYEDNEYENIYGSGFEMDMDLGPGDFDPMLLQSFELDGRSSLNGYRISSTSMYSENHVMSKSDMRIKPSSFVDKRNGLIPENSVLSGVVACSDYQYANMSIDERVLMEIQSIGLYPEPVPDLTQISDEEISGDISKLEDEYRQQVSKKKSLLDKLLKSTSKIRELQEKEFERNALDKLAEMAYQKYMSCWGPNAAGGKGAGGKIAKQAALAFVKRTLERCQEFEETGKSCFNEPLFKDMFHSRPSLPLDSTTDVLIGTQQSPSVSNHENYDSLLSVNEQTINKEENWSNRVKKRELHLDEVFGGSIGTSSGIGTSLASSAKGKRSERDRSEVKVNNRDMSSRNTNPKIGRPASNNIKGERKSKAKPKQKTTHLSASVVNGTLGKISEKQPKSAPTPKSNEISTSGTGGAKDDFGLDVSNNSDPLDLLQIDDLDGQGQDIGSWLNIDDDVGLQDDDFMGLEIPMDDLSDLNMMV